MGRYWSGQSIRLNGPVEGDHESYNTKVSTILEYTSNKKTALKNTYPFGRSSDDRHTGRKKINMGIKINKRRDSVFLITLLVKAFGIH